MAPKKATGAAAATKAKKPASGESQSTRDMIKEAIITLKERNGSSRQAIKKYIISNKKVAEGKAFDSQFNRALKAGVEKNEFAQPKGSSGPVKLAQPAKKTAAPATKKTAAAKPKTETKDAKPKKTAATKKAAAPKKAAAAGTKKAAAPKKAAAAKPKANTSSKRKTTAAAPAVVDKPTTLTKTKSGRVAKTTATAGAKKAAPKKAAPKKAAAKKEAPKTEA